MSWSFVPQVTTDDRFVTPDGELFDTIVGYADYMSRETPVQFCCWCHTVDVSGDQYPFAVEHGLSLCTPICGGCGEAAMPRSNPNWDPEHPFCVECGDAG